VADDSAALSMTAAETDVPAGEARLRMSPDKRSEAIDLISRMKEVRSSLRPSERRVTDIILQDIEYAVHATASDLAERARVSEPTVTRLSRALGCTGVRDFKVKLAQSLIVGSIFLREPPEATAGDQAALPFVKGIFSNARAALSRAEQQLTDDRLRQAIDIVADAGQVFVFGVGGGSTAIAVDMQFRLFRYGMNVTAYSDVYLMRMAAATLTAGDAVVALSATGSTPEILDAAALAQQYRAKVVALTRPGSELAQIADVALTVDVPETTDVLSPTASRYAFLALVDLIAAGCGYRLGSSAQEKLRRIKYNLLNLRGGDVLEPLGD